MIEIFKTNIRKRRASEQVINRLLEILPGAVVHFDLDDCDRILRVENRRRKFEAQHVIVLVNEMGFECEVLSDEVYSDNKAQIKN